MSNTTRPYGPFQTHEARKFVASVVGAHADSKNNRYNLDAVAEDLSNRAFDSSELWLTLESNRIIKRDKRTYSA